MTEERFWAKVNKEGPDGCWEWLACKWYNGYGKFNCNGKSIRAHRYSWILKNGAIPEGLLVRHKCRGKCVNPDHLELGTIAENNADKIRDKTSLRGEEHPNNKLNKEQILEIRARGNELHKDLAKEYNVCKSVISNIIHRRRWAWLT